MREIHYLKDTKKFWKAREKARLALDHKRAKASHAEKNLIARKLHSDAEFMKRSRIASSSH